MPLTGIEPVRYRYRGILSPLRLPVPPQRHNMVIVAQKGGNVNLPAGCFCTKRARKYPAALKARNFLPVQMVSAEKVQKIQILPLVLLAVICYTDMVCLDRCAHFTVCGRFG
jgi:hypothetical protein